MKITPPALLRSFFSLAVIEALAGLVYLLVNSTGEGNSASRLVVIAALAVSLLVSAWFTSLSIIRRGWAESMVDRLVPTGKAWMRWAWTACAVFIVFGLAACLPAYRLGVYAPYWTHLQPWLVWVMLVSLQTVLALLFARSGITRANWKRVFQEQRTILVAGLVVLALFVVFWLIVDVSRLGLTRDEFWDRTGVPLLNLQVLAGVAVSLLAAGLGTSLAFRRNKLRLGIWLDVALFVLIWCVAAIAWNSTPQTHNHFAPGPYPPNYVYYPYSDAMNYDLDAQYPLMGMDRGANSSRPDKPLYSTFLVYLHAIAGQNITSVVSLQVEILAVFPALLYLLGKALRSRAVGLFAAALAIFKEINAIRGSLIIWTVSTPKMLMSEFPTAVGLVLLSLLVFLWLRDTRRKPVYAMAAGGVLGLMTMIRNNSWLLLPVIILIAWLVYRRQWKHWLAASGLLFMVLLVAIAPWQYRNYQVNGSPFYFLTTLQKTIWKNRYLPVIQTARTPTVQAPVPAGPVVQATPAAAFPTQDITAHQAVSGSSSLSGYKSIVLFVANNFSHNLITTALTLPTAFMENDLDHVVNDQGPGSLWAVNWHGQLSLPAFLLLTFELGVIALGIGYCWSRWKVAGLAPLLIALAYMFSLGLARTSGGRYIVPVDWVTYFYFGLGLAQVGVWAARLWQITRGQLDPVVQPDREIRYGAGRWSSGLAVVLVVFLAGLSIPLSSKFFNNPYPTLTRSGVLQLLEDDGLLNKLGYSQEDLENFSRLPVVYISYGRGFFPRYLDYSADVFAKEVYNDLPKTEPHLVFEMLNPNDWYTIDLPLDSSPAYFPNASDVIVVGCRSGHTIEGRVVVILGQRPVIYVGSPKKPLSCP